MPLAKRPSFSPYEPVYFRGRVWWVSRNYNDGFYSICENYGWKTHWFWPNEYPIHRREMYGDSIIVNGCHLLPVSEELKCTLIEAVQKSDPTLLSSKSVQSSSSTQP